MKARSFNNTSSTYNNRIKNKKMMIRSCVCVCIWYCILKKLLVQAFRYDIETREGRGRMVCDSLVHTSYNCLKIHQESQAHRTEDRKRRHIPLYLPLFSKKRTKNLFNIESNPSERMKRHMWCLFTQCENNAERVNKQQQFYGRRKCTQCVRCMNEKQQQQKKNGDIETAHSTLKMTCNTHF